jgi:hypothetical protein
MHKALGVITDTSKKKATTTERKKQAFVEKQCKKNAHKNA